MDASFALLDTISIPGVNGIYSWNVTSSIGGAHGLGGAIDLLTLVVRPDLAQQSLGIGFGPHFGSREGAAARIPILQVTVVPEPSTALLLGLGLGMLKMCRRP